MSGECDECGEHCLDCMCNKSNQNQVGMLFAMPFGQTLEIRSSQLIIDVDIDMCEEIDGITYSIYWNGERLPWCANTLLSATAIAMGCQYGAQQIMKKTSLD
jgi:hypothetical protein